MDKIIIIKEFTDNVSSGGVSCFKRNITSLSHFFDIEYCPIAPIEPTAIQKVKRLISSPIPTLFSKNECKRIENFIKNSDAKYVFLNSSILGHFAKVSKKYGKKVITYFQNFEYQLTRDIRSFVWVKPVKTSERNSLIYSDYCVFLTERDRDNVLNYYAMKDVKNAIIPITLGDQFVEEKDHKETKPYGLFVGSYYKPNLEAVDFINENICDGLDIELRIVGYNLENYEVKNKRKNLNVVGFAKDIKEEYNNALFSILPIFSGSGMKVKTCEALMFGKVLFASKEALEGYKVDSEDIHLCETKEDFIEAIKKYLDNPKFVSKQNRKIYLENYSNKVADERFKEIVEELNK